MIIGELSVTVELSEAVSILAEALRLIPDCYARQKEELVSRLEQVTQVKTYEQLLALAMMEVVCKHDL